MAYGQELTAAPATGSVVSTSAFGTPVFDDDTNLWGRIQYVRRISPGSALTASLAADPVLVLPVVASAVYDFECRIRYSGDSPTPGFQANWSIPTAATIEWETPDGTNGTAPSGSQYSGIFSGTGSAASWSTQNGNLAASITGVLTTGANAGNLQLLVARVAAGTVTVLTNSRLKTLRVG